MKKLLLICLAFVTMQATAQDLKSMATSASSGDSSSLIDGLAADQVKSLAKKLNLSDAQQEQVSALVVSTLKSDKFKSMLGDLDPSALMGSNDKKAEITDAMMKDENFRKGMGEILTDEQKKTMKEGKKMSKKG